MKYFISICAAFAIIGCGTNSDYKAEDGGAIKDDIKTEKPKPPIDQTYKDKGGLKGIVYGAKANSKVCFDTNVNGLCDTNEKSEKVFEGGKFSFEKSVSDANSGQILLAQIQDNEYLTSLTNNITPYTTLVVNETMYNPNANNNKSNAIEILKSKFDENLLKGELPTSDDAKSLYDTFQKAIIEQKNDNYAAIANAVDSIYKQNTLSPNIIITKQTKAKDLQGTKLSISNKNTPITWEKYDADETFMGFSSNKQNAISYSRWHNALRVVDKNTNMLKHNSKFLYIDGERHDTDSQSGASEQVLSKAVIDKQDNVFALVTELGENSANAAGVYKVNVSVSIPDTKYASVPKGANFYQTEANDIAIYDKKLIIGHKKGLDILLSNDLSSPIKSLELGRIENVFLTKDFVFAGLKKAKNNQLVILDHSLSLLKTLKINELTSSDKNFIYPNKIIANDKFLFFSVYDLSENGLSNQIFVYDITDKEFSLKKQLSVTSEVVGLNFSDDGKFLLVSTYGKKLEIFEIGSFSQISQTLDNIPKGAFMNDNTIGVAYSGGFELLNAKQEASVFSEADKEKWTNVHRK